MFRPSKASGSAERFGQATPRAAEGLAPPGGEKEISFARRAQKVRESSHIEELSLPNYDADPRGRGGAKLSVAPARVLLPPLQITPKHAQLPELESESSSASEIPDQFSDSEEEQKKNPRVQNWISLPLSQLAQISETNEYHLQSGVGAAQSGSQPPARRSGSQRSPQPQETSILPDTDERRRSALRGPAPRESPAESPADKRLTQETKVKMKLQSEKYFSSIVQQLGQRRRTFRKFGFKRTDSENDIYIKPILKRLGQSDALGSMNVVDLWPEKNHKQCLQMNAFNFDKVVIKKLNDHLKRRGEHRVSDQRVDHPALASRRYEQMLTNQIYRENVSKKHEEHEIEHGKLDANLGAFIKYRHTPGGARPATGTGTLQARFRRRQARRPARRRSLAAERP